MWLADDSHANYCTEWKLKVNTTKTKILLFSSGRVPKDQQFYFKGEPLEMVNEYKYLGIFLTRRGSYLSTKKYIADQANHALFSLLRKTRTLDLFIDLQIELFNKTFKPILLYGSEIWGFGNLEVIERVQLKFFRQILNMKKPTPSYMIYGEIRAFPLYLDIYSRMISFWTKLRNNGKNEIAFSLYALIAVNTFKRIWKHMESSKSINRKWFIEAFKKILKDQYIQNWNSLVDKSSSGINYRLFKDKFEINKYFTFLSKAKSQLLTAFRTRNHRLPVEIGRWSSIPINERICWLCNAEVGDEYHYIMKCASFKEKRNIYIAVLRVISKQKCIDYIEKWPFMVIFLYNLYYFWSIFEQYYIQNRVITNRVIKRLLCSGINLDY